MNKPPFHHCDILIIIFAREPVTGQVKTRLIPALGEEGATSLYKQLLNVTIKNVIAADLSPVNLCITPDSRITFFSQMSCSASFELSVQVGNDLGERMYNALERALKNYSKAILIGTDCPFLSSDDLQQAISALDEHDMVFSPAKDGGYVLVGAKKVNPVIFEHIDWGTDKVMEKTRETLLKHHINWLELTEQHDIDVEDDLRKLLLHNDFKHFVYT